MCRRLAGRCGHWSAGAWAHPAELDEAAGGVGIARHEIDQLAVGLEHVEQSEGDAAMQGADHRLVLAYGVAVWAVAQAQTRLVWRFLTTGGPEMLAMMNRPPGEGDAPHEHHH